MSHRVWRVAAVAAVFAVAAFSACRPSVSGAWEGEAVCNQTVLPLSALFAEQSDLEVEGIIYIENFFGFIVRGDINDGEYDPDDNAVKGDLDTNGDDRPNVEFDFDIDDDDPDSMEGDADILDDNGEVNVRCDAELDRLD